MLPGEFVGLVKCSEVHRAGQVKGPGVFQRETVASKEDLERTQDCPGQRF